MSDTPSMRETVLKLCAQASPEPWYPGEFAKSMGIDRARIDPALEELRMTGLVELTEWLPGKGQGYRLTLEGESVVRSSRRLASVREGQIIRRSATPPPRREYDRTAFGRGEQIRNALVFPERPNVTYALMVTNIVIFVVGLLIAFANNRAWLFIAGGDEKTLQLTGAVTGEAIVNGQWWRLATACFVHWGFFHVFVNMYSLYVIGPIVEPLWGRFRFLVIYLIAGFGGSCLAIWHNPFSHLAGASGAIWGLLGGLGVWWVMNREHLPSTLVRTQLNWLFSVVIMNGVLSFLPGISWMGHFAGGTVGAVVAALLQLHRFGRPGLRWLLVPIVALIPLACLSVVIRDLDKSQRWKDVGLDAEIADFNRRVIPEIEKVSKRYERINLDDFEEQAAMRNAAQVHELRTELAALRSDAESAILAIDARLFQSALVASVSKKASTYLHHVIQLSEKVDNYLANDRDFDATIATQIERTQNAKRMYSASLRDN